MTTGLLSVYCMKGEIFGGLASFFHDFKDRAQTLYCICHHVASLHDRQFFFMSFRRGMAFTKRAMSARHAKHKPSPIRLWCCCSLFTSHLPLLVPKCLLCRLVINIPRWIPRLILPSKTNTST